MPRDAAITVYSPYLASRMDLRRVPAYSATDRIVKSGAWGTCRAERHFPQRISLASFTLGKDSPHRRQNGGLRRRNPAVQRAQKPVSWLPALFLQSGHTRGKTEERISFSSPSGRVFLFSATGMRNRNSFVQGGKRFAKFNRKTILDKEGGS